VCDEHVPAVAGYDQVGIKLAIEQKRYGRDTLGGCGTCQREPEQARIWPIVERDEESATRVRLKPIDPFDLDGVDD
jgi:hypothetical protein